MTEATAKNYLYGHAPKRIELLGDKQKRPESAEHIIEFPGGAIEVARTSDGNYWAHIIVNRGQAFEDCNGRTSARGEVMGSRIQRPDGLTPIERHEDVSQIAVLIKPTRTTPPPPVPTQPDEQQLELFEGVSQ